MTRSTPILLSSAWLVACCFGAAAATAQASPRPGIIELAGEWRLGTEAAGPGDREPAGVSLPAMGSDLGVKTGSGRLRLEREVALGVWRPPGWRC